MRVVVDYNLCEAHGRCVDADPEVFEIREDDQMYLLQESPSGEHEARLRRAVDSCPRTALTLRE